MGHGIDYGMGQTNIDKATGIRFGVINQNEVLQSWCDSAEADYGDPTCPKCGNEAVGIDDDNVPVIDEYDGDDWDFDGSEYACLGCQWTFDGEDAFGDTPNGWTLDDGEYQATQNGENYDIFIIKSPYYTRAAYCSPCAPGACYLASPCDDGDKAYCFGHDWFEDGKAPYPVYRVSDDCLVNPGE